MIPSIPESASTRPARARLAGTDRRRSVRRPALRSTLALLIFGFSLFSSLLGFFPSASHAGHPPTPGCTDCDDPPQEKKKKKCEDPDCCDGAGGGKVDFWSGQEFFTHTDLTLPGLMGIRVKRLYDSRADFDSALGYGWALNYFIRVYEYADGSAVIRQNCGYRGVFVPAGGTYQTPVGMTGTLTKTASGWTYAQKNGENWEFDVQGRLAAMVSRSGPRLVFSYDSRGKLPPFKAGVLQGLGFAWEKMESVSG